MEQPSRAPVREQQQQQQVVRPTVESVAPPPARITAPVPSKSSQQQSSRVQQPAVVDYDDFAAGEEEFVEYDDFSDGIKRKNSCLATSFTDLIVIHIFSRATDQASRSSATAGIRGTCQVNLAKKEEKNS